MAEHDLFDAEAHTLLEAERTVAEKNLPAESYRAALQHLVEEYRRLIRESSRLIRHSDRQERELTQLNSKLRILAAELDYKATHDALTGVFNRGAIIERVSEHLKNDDVVLIVLDIDHFKRVNDEFGHPAGDAVIVEVVERLKSVVADSGDIGRVGGEEFTIAIPSADISQGARIGEMLRTSIAATPFAALAGQTVTASFGVSNNKRGSSFDEAYARADGMLYNAKREGRNAVRC